MVPSSNQFRLKCKVFCSEVKFHIKKVIDGFDFELVVGTNFQSPYTLRYVTNISVQYFVGVQTCTVLQAAV